VATFNHISIRFLKIRLKTKAFLFALLFPAIIFGQLQENDQETDLDVNKPSEIQFNPLVDNIQEKLPPLEVLIDSAIKNAPKIRMREAEISLAQFNLKVYKWSWTRNLGLVSNLSYGNNYNFSTSETSSSTPTEFLSSSSSTIFSVGFNMRFPLFELINYKNAINIGKREIETKMLMREEMIRETKQDVILVYQDLLLHQDLLKVKNEAQITSAIQVKMAEKEFLNGKISIAELSRLTESHSMSLYNYKKDRMLFYRQYLILEQMVGMKFNLLNEIY
jgi:outer membrane protein TolC